MRSVFLEGIVSDEQANMALNAEFSAQPDSTTKVVYGPNGTDSIGWLYVTEPADGDEQLGPFMIMADYSGRSYDYDAKGLVVEAVKRVQARLGGQFRDYGD